MDIKFPFTIEDPGVTSSDVKSKRKYLGQNSVQE